MRFIWATRGRTWGFRFLRDGGLADPLSTYEGAFSGHTDESHLIHRTEETTALRFPDPEGREDRAGRVIPHEFVLFPPLSGEIGSIEEGLETVWAQVADEFARVWDLPQP